MCANCQDMHDRWLYAEFQPRKWRQFNMKKEQELIRSLESRTTQHEQFRTLKRQQLADIREGCRHGRHQPSPKS